MSSRVSPEPNWSQKVRYIPANVNGKQVVVSQGGDAFLVDNIELRSAGMPGVQGRFSKDLDDKDPSAIVMFGSKLQGELEGDWLKAVLPDLDDKDPSAAVTFGSKLQGELEGDWLKAVLPEPAAAAWVPAGVPANSHVVHEKYVGPNTKMFGLGGCLLCGCLALLIFACPVDERDVYVAPNGAKYTLNGARIQ
ncbi:unnamed protein product [Prorocentrum cordatum]|uniref:Altered inheritance of mitochondria protein 24, mitochondrial n=1 Tax=Prorocentrum cordatum TaxID=2364126 RepID=A0ABN9V7S4_9DINO|nr:unnamed protein product [Polarella glacialis]